MNKSVFYKAAARLRIDANYRAVILGTIIYMIPTYLSLQLSTLMTVLPGAMSVVNILFVIFVLDIFNVGYIRFLSLMRPKNEIPEGYKYDYNSIFFGYTNSFKNVLKSTCIREIKLVGWSLLPFAPLILCIGIAILAVVCSNDGGQLVSYLTQLAASPTWDMTVYTAEFFAEKFSWLLILLPVSLAGMIALFIPYVYKRYEYAVIDMILADEPALDSEEVFKLSRNIMHGFRKRYFMLQVSFILYLVIIQMTYSITDSYFMYCLVQCFFLPYMKMTFIEFYRERKCAVNEQNC